MHTNKVATGTQRSSGPGSTGGHNNSDTTIAIVITDAVPTTRRTAVATTATTITMTMQQQWRDESHGTLQETTAIPHTTSCAQSRVCCAQSGAH